MSNLASASGHASTQHVQYVVKMADAQRCGVKLQRCGVKLQRCGVKLQRCGVKLQRCGVAPHRNVGVWSGCGLWTLGRWGVDVLFSTC